MVSFVPKMCQILSQNRFEAYEENLENRRLLEQGSTRLLRWALWLDGFDFDIVYKSSAENYLADMLTREGSQEIKEIKMFRPLRQDEASSSVQSRRVSQVIVCSQCHYHFCWDCFVKKFESLPLSLRELVLQKWFESEDSMWSYARELPYRERPWRVYYTLSREVEPCYLAFIQKIDWTWHDYFTIHQKARIHGSVKVIFYAIDIDSVINWWSPWFKIFLVKYMPRVNWMLEHDTQCTLSTLKWELHIAAQNDHVIEFTLVHQDSLIVANEDDQSFSHFVRFLGRISVEEQFRPQICIHSHFIVVSENMIPHGYISLMKFLLMS